MNSILFLSSVCHIEMKMVINSTVLVPSILKIAFLRTWNSKSSVEIGKKNELMSKTFDFWSHREVALALDL